MRSIILGTALGLAGLSAVHAQQPAADVYQWKDASGVTHYSQTPPAQGRYEQRAISHGGAAAPVVAAASVPAVNAHCTTARGNIAALQGDGDVQQDTDGDGKPDATLDAAARSSQLELAQAAVKAYCTP